MKYKTDSFIKESFSESILEWDDFSLCNLLILFKGDGDEDLIECCF